MLQTCRKGDLDQIECAEVPEGSFVGVVHCAKWIPSVKHAGKYRVALNIAEVYLLTDAPDDFIAA